MESIIVKELRLRYHPVAIPFTDEKPADASQIREGRWGCVMALYTNVIKKGKMAVFDRDIYGCFVGVGFAPSIVPEAFRHEEPEFTEMWGNSAFADNMFEFGEIAGNSAVPIGLAAATWGIGKLVGSSRMSAFGTDLIRAQAIDGLFTSAIKVGTYRTRPNHKAFSYPSGHTSSAFTTAGVVYSHFGKK